jgi:hypothetical protein
VTFCSPVLAGRKYRNVEGRKSTRAPHEDILAHVCFLENRTTRPAELLILAGGGLENAYRKCQL